MKKRVLVTGLSAITPLGHDWESVFQQLKTYKNAVKRIDEWKEYEGLYSILGVPIENFPTSERFTRKTTRSMGKVALMAASATERALLDANLLDDPLVKSGNLGVAYGSSAGSAPAIVDFGGMILHKNTRGINANTYIKMMSHTAPINLSVFFGITGRIFTTSSACTSGSQGIGYAYETIRNGYQIAMVAGGAEELTAADVAVFDTLFATSTCNDTPELTPRPFDTNRDGLVLGEGAATLVLEEYEHAKARGAKIYAEIIGFGTNCDGTHITNPNYQTMKRSMELALQDAQLPPSAIAYVNAHGTGTQHGDIAETKATNELFGSKMRISSLKSYMGHTLGACGAIEAWACIHMMNNNWVAPTINLIDIDPNCAELDYLTNEGCKLDCEYIMSNNFAFGGVNTSLIFKKWK